MKFSSIVLLSTLWSATAALQAALTPFRVSYDSLVHTPTSESDSFLEALTTTGMVSVTDLPKAAKKAAVIMASTQHQCLLEATHKQEQVLADGTLRRTVASQTVGGGMQPLNLETAVPSPACESFDAASTMFRQTTQTAVHAVARLVTRDLPHDGRPLLMTAGNKKRGEEPFAFATFADVVVHGDHLEHFHSYQKMESSKDGTVSTIDVHTDQGLFLAFTPGRLSNGELTKGFFIETAAGELQEVAFDEQDDLVFLLGDGVNQIVNDKVIGNKLRAVPHALQLQASTDKDQARVWYGLMVLPPSSAVHPSSTDVTFGEIRQRLIQGSHTDDTVHLACSSASQGEVSSVTHSVVRHLSDDVSPKDCNNATQVYCWHQCQNKTAEHETCGTNSRKLACADASGALWSGTTHGRYSLQCVALDAPMEVVAANEPDPVVTTNNATNATRVNITRSPPSSSANTVVASMAMVTSTLVGLSMLM